MEAVHRDEIAAMCSRTDELLAAPSPRDRWPARPAAAKKGCESVLRAADGAPIEEAVA